MWINVPGTLLANSTTLLTPGVIMIAKHCHIDNFWASNSSSENCVGVVGIVMFVICQNKAKLVEK